MKKYNPTVVPSGDVEIDPAEYGLNIEEIRKTIKSLSEKHEETLPDEKYPKDTIDKYQTFAKEHLGFEFNDVSLFITALTHRSYVNEHRSAHIEHNERLEYLGDAILELVTSDFLFRHFHEQEGLMTAWRASLVRTESIFAASEEIGYTNLIRMSKGQQNSAGQRINEKLVADCFEAVTGAIYLDQGYEAAKRHVYKYILVHMPQILEEEAWRDPKSHLQEIAQKTDGEIPQYHLVKLDGPDHNHTFTIQLTIGGHVRGTGTGNTKQEAQANAAKEGIKYYKSQKNAKDDGKLSSKNL
ncbi:MAG: ribonuclease III [Candidatus Saccharibacteria bacterium]|nr:ribonuclease III [Candidatus Saccharibacteria bacterium]